MTLLRPIAWLMLLGAEVGAEIPVQLPELGLVGPACVTAVAACPPIEEGPGRVVLSTVTHLNGDVRRVWLNGLAEPLEPTGTHRLYSEDRGDWVPVADLAVAERLRTLTGPLAITRIDSRPGVHRVYNLEVETEHCYFVSTAGVLSHNEDPCGVRVLQSGGHTLYATTAKGLNESLGTSYHPREWGRALEDLKKLTGRSSGTHSHKILSDASVYDSHSGDFLGNLLDHLE